MTKIRIVKPKVWNFQVIGGKDAWREVVYSARVSGVPENISDEEVFIMIIRNDYTSAAEHIIIKFDVKVSKGIAPELLEHRIASHTGYSTRYSKVDKRYMDEEGYEVICPWHLLKKWGSEEWALWEDTVRKAIMRYEELINRGVPRESARYVLPFCQAVGIYHMTWNLRSLLNLLSLRLCVRASPEFRCIAAQIYFNLIEQLPIMRGLVGCRGFMRGVCPEEGVTGVREGKQHPVYPPCPFKNPQSEVFIPTRSQIKPDGIRMYFMEEMAVKKMEKLFVKWAAWNG